MTTAPTTAPRTYDELQEEIRKLEEEAEIAKHLEIEAFLAEVKPKIIKYGVTAEQLGFAASAAPALPLEGKKAAASKTAAVKYRYGEQTWSGRGRKPKWAQDLGDDLELHLVSVDTYHFIQQRCGSPVCSVCANGHRTTQTIGLLDTSSCDYHSCIAIVYKSKIG